MATVTTAPVPRLPIGRGRPGGVVAGLGVAPWLPSDTPVAWFRGDPALAHDADTRLIARTVRSGVDAGVPVVGVLGQAGVAPQTGLDPLCGWGAVARELTAASGQVPIVLVVAGPFLGGPALLLGLADVVVMTAEARAFVNAPASVARITGSAVLDAELIGGSWVHATRTGVADVVVDDLAAAQDVVADLLALLPATTGELPTRVAPDDPPDRPTPVAAAAVPAGERQSYDVRTVIGDLVDDGWFLELRSRHATSLVTGLARIAGMPVGIVANQPSQLAGALDIESSQKGGAFVRFCDAFNLPLVTLVDTPGFRHGAKLAFAYAEATVPRVCVVLRKAYGGAYIVMDCKSMGNDCALAWPGAEIAVMGARGAVEVLARRELAALPEGPEREARRARLEDEYAATHLSPEAALDRGYVDEVIDPADTRRAVAGALAALTTKRERLRPRRHENITL